MRTITVKLPRLLAERLGRAAVRRGSTRSAVVRQAIEEHLTAGSGGTEESCFDLAPDLAGAVRGRSDLSSQRLRLGGYGR